MGLLSYHLFCLSESASTDDLQKWNFHLIPDGKNNYRSAQMPLHLLPKICKEMGVKKVIRLNWDGNDGKHFKSQKSVSIDDEKKALERVGITFFKLSSGDGSDQKKINDLLKDGNCLVHCAHGADRTGGAIGAYLYSESPNPDILTTDQIWHYTTQHNDWNSILNQNPEDFKKRYYLGQAKKFGVEDLDHAIKLAKKHK